MRLLKAAQLLTFAALLALAGSGCVGLVPSTVKSERDIEYAQVDGHSLKLDIYSPKKPVGKLPVLIYIHGGSWKSGSKSPCPIAFIAAQNVAIVSIDYRLSGIAPFPAALYDCKGAVRWLRANAEKYNLDPDHIGLGGVSAGGHLAALMGTTANVHELEGETGGNLSFSSQVQCVCAFYAPIDMDVLVTNELSRTSSDTDIAQFLGGALVQKLDVASEANPIRYATKDAAPFFIMHGASDSLVPVEQSRLLYAALKKAGAPVQLEVVPGGHGIRAPDRVAKEIYQFYHTYLGIALPAT